MRSPIIFILTLFCFAMSFSETGINPGASNLDYNVMQTVKKNLDFLTYLDLCFAKNEFLELIKNDVSVRDTWKEQLAEIAKLPNVRDWDYSLDDQII